ncbi:hypothetical protein D3C80_1412130 [compost metagenome]
MQLRGKAARGSGLPGGLGLGRPLGHVFGVGGEHRRVAEQAIGTEAGAPLATQDPGQVQVAGFLAAAHDLTDELPRHLTQARTDRLAQHRHGRGHA